MKSGEKKNVSFLLRARFDTKYLAANLNPARRSLAVASSSEPTCDMTRDETLIRDARRRISRPMANATARARLAAAPGSRLETSDAGRRQTGRGGGTPTRRAVREMHSGP